MEYEKLLLSRSGGVFSAKERTGQATDVGTLCIGIGGAGIEALSDLRGKIHHYLIPDDPDAPVPAYDGIQLLGIDSDTIDYRRHPGDNRLTEEEFFSLFSPNLVDIFHNDALIHLIRNDPHLTWMDIDRFHHLAYPAGSGSIRQIGRFLLFNKVRALASTLQQKCAAALRARHTDALDVFLFAGLSGGTGSGCFLDVCYLLQHFAQCNGWNIKIIGCFFLPDVMNCRIYSHDLQKTHLNANGYAALKELDYLMNLTAAHDWFEQEYCPAIHIRTQDPPVHMCHLISALRADGTVRQDGHAYGIQLASDYVLNCLRTGFLHQRMPQISRSVLGIPRYHGANMSYHFLGGITAEVPTTQINTYLAAGFFKRFRKLIPGPETTLSQEQVHQFLKELHLTANDVMEAIRRDVPGCELPRHDKLSELANSCPWDTMPPEWAQAGRHWHTRAKAVINNNQTLLCRELASLDFDQEDNSSMISRLFRKLKALCLDPQYGPYYAAALLNGGEHNLMTALAGEIAAVRELYDKLAITMPSRRDRMDQLSLQMTKFWRRRSTYHEYRTVCTQYLQTDQSLDELKLANDALHQFLRQAEDLYHTCFLPLCTLLDNLDKTFRANEEYLNDPQNTASTDTVWRILTLNDVRQELDAEVDALTPKQLVTDFIRELMLCPNDWLDGNPDKISRMVRNLMTAQFPAISSLSLQNYLFKLFPHTRNEVVRLSREIEQNILPRIRQLSAPDLPHHDAFNFQNPSSTFGTNRLMIPADCYAGHQAAQQLSGFWCVDEDDMKYRIYGLQLLSGAPLFAFGELPRLKSSYDKSLTHLLITGIHLYSKTKRCKHEGLEKDWRTDLPDPVPYSLFAEGPHPGFHTDGKEIIDLYSRAVDLGIIVPIAPGKGPCLQFGGNDDYYILRIPDDPVPDYRLEDFLEDHCFLLVEYEHALHSLQYRIRNRASFAQEWGCSPIKLQNDGDCNNDTPQIVRLDYFIQHRRLHQIVRNEIRKELALRDAHEKLLEIWNEYALYRQDLMNFTALLFDGTLKCSDFLHHIDYEHTRFVFFDYIDKYERTQTFYLVDSHVRFPLYEAFVSFRELAKTDKYPWKFLRRRLDELDSPQEYQTSDFLIAATLEKVWDRNALEQLRDEVRLIKGEAKDILRFYEGLCECIRQLRDDAPFWPDSDNYPPSENQPDHYYFYPHISEFYAWNPLRSEWELLREDMKNKLIVVPKPDESENEGDT